MQKYVYCNPLAPWPVLTNHGAVYMDESKVSIRLRLGYYTLPFPVRLVCPILRINRRGWVWALQPPCAVDRLPCGRSINHYLISTYLPIFQSSLCLAAGCLGWGRPRGVAYSAAALCGSPGCNDTIMKPQSHRTVASMGSCSPSFCFAPRRRQRYVFAPGILQKLVGAVEWYYFVWGEVYQSNCAGSVVGGDIPFTRFIPHVGGINAVTLKHLFHFGNLLHGERLAAVQTQRPCVTVVDAHGSH